VNTTPRNTRNIRGRKIRLTAATIATLSLVAAACGDDADDSASAEAAAVATTEAMAPESTDAMATETMAMDADGPFGDGCAAVPADGEGSFDGMADDPAATAASNNPVLSTLVTAVTAAGLVDTLNSEGPFTIFAPTNDAFAAIPPADLEAVLADTDLLTSILTFHVIAGESLSSADLAELGTSVTVNGSELEFADDDGVLTVNGVAAGCQDVQVANGTVHIIGEVLMPG
jgi:transforming growth factor-beta-induced protein